MLLGETLPEITNVYDYDEANRLIEVNGVEYRWDGNGNLLYDGENQYTYNNANQLIEVENAAGEFDYSYNGLGDRVGQIANGEVTQFTLDMNSGLTQVLQDGVNTYLYGVNRIAQISDTQMGYFLPDALGSVRKIVDGAGAVTLTQSYTPYGEILYSSGEAVSDYAFTGEMYDPQTGLVYLRARYYSPAEGRFVGKDTWVGNYLRPMSINKWIYVEGDPINYVDPSGLIRNNETETNYANAIVSELQSTYRVGLIVDWGYQFIPNPIPDPPDPLNSQTQTICYWQEGSWTINELHTLLQGVQSLSYAMKGANKFIENIGGVTVSQDPINARGLTSPHRIKFTNSSDSIDTWTVVHELAHAWDANYSWRLSKNLEEYTKGFTSINGAAGKWKNGECDQNQRLPGCNNAGYFYGGTPPAGSDANFNRLEDFAESVTAYVYPVEAQRKVIAYKEMKGYEFLYYSDYTKLPRWAFVNQLIEGNIAQ